MFIADKLGEIWKGTSLKKYLSENLPFQIPGINIFEFIRSISAKYTQLVPLLFLLLKLDSDKNRLEFFPFTKRGKGAAPKRQNIPCRQEPNDRAYLRVTVNPWECQECERGRVLTRLFLSDLLPQLSKKPHKEKRG